MSVLAVRGQAIDLPQITIERPRLRFWPWFALRISPLLAVPIVFAIVGIARHESGIIFGGVATFGAVIVILAIELPLAFAAIARLQRKLMESRSLPPGTLFAARGSQIGYLAGAVSGLAESRGGLRRGVFILDGDGVQFRASGGTSEPWDTALTWNQIARLDVRPGSSPRTARINVVTPDGKTVLWRVYGLDKLSAALDRLRQDQKRSTGPVAGIQSARPSSAPPPPADGTAQGWYADPAGIHEQRYFSAGRPTLLVKDGTVESRDPMPPDDAIPRRPPR